MKAVLGILGAFVLIATIAADVPIFSENVLREYYKFKEETVPAALTNYGTGVKLEMKELPTKGEIILSADENSLGLDLKNVQNDFSLDKIILLSVSVNTQKNDVESLYFTVVFESDQPAQVPTKAPLSSKQIPLDLPSPPRQVLLDIPVFELPADLAGASKEVLNKKEIQVLPPLSPELLSDITKGRSATLNFEWLKQLLAFGMYENGETRMLDNMYPTEESYITRPVCLSKIEIDKLLDVVITVAGLEDDDDDDDDSIFALRCFAGLRKMISGNAH